MFAPRKIPRPAGESAGLRDDNVVRAPAQDGNVVSVVPGAVLEHQSADAARTLK